MREAIDAASKLDEVPPILANAGRLSHKYQWFQGCRGKGFLYFQAVYWHHADSQLRERLQMEARILLLREVERLTLLSKASIYRQMQMGTFPMPLRLGQPGHELVLLASLGRVLFGLLQVGPAL